MKRIIIDEDQITYKTIKDAKANEPYIGVRNMYNGLRYYVAEDLAGSANKTRLRRAGHWETYEDIIKDCELFAFDTAESLSKWLAQAESY